MCMYIFVCSRKEIFYSWKLEERIIIDNLIYELVQVKFGIALTNLLLN